MPISFDNAGSTVSSTATNSPVVDITSAKEGSLCFANFNYRLATSTVSSFTGWTSAGIGKTIALVGSYDVWYRVKQSGDTTFTASLGASNPGIVEWASYLGVQQNSSGFESAGSTTFTNTAYTTPSETPIGPKRWALAFFDGQGGTGVTAITFPNPTGMQIRHQDFVGAISGNRQASAIADSAGYCSNSSQTYTSVPSVTGGTASSGYAALLFLIEEPLVDMSPSGNEVPSEQAVMRAVTF